MEVNNYIVLSVGQAGNQIATNFGKRFAKNTVSMRKPVWRWARSRSATGRRFSVGSGIGGRKSYAPRAVMVDLEPSVVQEAQKSCGSLFNPANMITRIEGAGGNFAVGYLTEGREVLDQALERLEHEISKTDNMGGIFVIHSLGGGTGSGLGCLLMEVMRQHHPEIPIISVSVFPSPQVSSVVTEPYNTVFALHFLREVCRRVHRVRQRGPLPAGEPPWARKIRVWTTNLLITRRAGLGSPPRCASPAS